MRNSVWSACQVPGSGGAMLKRAVKDFQTRAIFGSGVPAPHSAALISHVQPSFNEAAGG